MTANREPELDLLPQDFNAEQATLGSILLEPGAVTRAFAVVGPDDFYRVYHQQIAAACKSCYQRNEPVDLLTVSAELRRLKQLEEVGGGEYLTALINEVPTAAHVVRYAAIVREKSLLRRMVKAAGEIQQSAAANPADVGKALAAAGEQFRALYREAFTLAVVPPATAEWDAQVAQLHADLDAPEEEVSEARFGITKLDHQTGGLGNERLVIVKADTKHGKSQLLRQCMMETARRIRDGAGGRVVVGFILEEGKRAWWRKTFSHLSGIDSRILLRRGWGKSYFQRHPDAEERLLRAESEILGLPLHVAFSTADLSQIEMACRTLRQEHEIALVGIDYYQLITGGATNARTEEQELTARGGRLQALAEELECPIVVPSQITEDGATRTRRTKGARGIEHNASLVLDWRRTVDNGVKQDSGHIACLVARNGPGFGAMPLVTRMDCGRFWDEDDYRQLQALEGLSDHDNN